MVYEKYESSDFEKLIEVGKQSYTVLKEVGSHIKPGVRLVDIAKEVEAQLKEKNLTCSFPVNISANDNAAHYTPSFNDPRVFSDGDVVKLDIGGRSADYLSDLAITVDLSGEHGKLVEASEKALENAISIVKAGRKVSEIGKEINSTYAKYGINPIKNLGGHGIAKGELHAEPFIPNFDNDDDTELEEGDFIAIETFATEGEGYVIEGDYVQIFSMVREGQLRDAEHRKIMDFISKNYSTYPFAMRWLTEEFGSEFKVKSALNEMASKGMIDAYPVLVERSKGIVAQTEKSMIVERDSCTVTTE